MSRGTRLERSRPRRGAQDSSHFSVSTLRCGADSVCRHFSRMRLKLARAHAYRYRVILQTTCFPLSSPLRAQWGSAVPLSRGLLAASASVHLRRSHRTHSCSTSAHRSVCRPCLMSPCGFSGPACTCFAAACGEAHRQHDTAFTFRCLRHVGLTFAKLGSLPYRKAHSCSAGRGGAEERRRHPHPV